MFCPLAEFRKAIGIIKNGELKCLENGFCFSIFGTKLKRISLGKVGMLCKIPINV